MSSASFTERQLPSGHRQILFSNAERLERRQHGVAAEQSYRSQFRLSEFGKLNFVLACHAIVTSVTATPTVVRSKSSRGNRSDQDCQVCR